MESIKFSLKIYMALYYIHQMHFVNIKKDSFKRYFQNKKVNLFGANIAVEGLFVISLSKS